ncbi:GGDEF domain-containing protein, partial [Sedimentibacter sp.]
DWIIAMGVHLDEIDAYTEKVNSEIDSLSSDSIIKLLGYIFVVLLLGFVILYLIGNKHLLTSTKSLEKEINIDTLTKASSRRSGEINLNSFFKQFKQTGEGPAIMMMDIDDYKHINDKYGHHVGDMVLTEIVDAIYHIIRNSDQLIRWGGDEFVGIFPGLREEHIIEFGEKLLEGISSLEVLVGNETISITASIGFSYFKDTDIDYSDALKRADEALYLSKEQGKNSVNMLL